MNNRKIVWMLVGMLVAVLVLGACAPAPETDAPAEPTPEAVVDPEEEAGGEEAAPGDVLSAAIAAVAAEYGVEVGDVTVVSAEQVDWTDGCLGLGGPAESCLAAITPGYRVIVEVDGEQIEVRTDTTGQAVRIAPGELDS